MDHIFRAFLATALLAGLAAQIAGAQSAPGPPAPEGRGPFVRHPIPNDEEQQTKPPSLATSPQLEKQRYLELRKETTELAHMADELRLAVAQSNEHTLPLELAKKADQVEKLSKRIRDRIKHGY